MDAISALVAALLPLAMLIGIYLFIARRLGMPRFRVGKAMLTARSATGPLIGLWLILLAATWTLMDLATRLPADQASRTITASAVVTVIGIAVIGLVVLQRVTVFVLSVLGIFAQVAGIAREFGVTAAALCLVSAALVTWLFGLTRGLLSRG
ncbi:hypothetical protein [Kribbella sp. NPDC051718]|uniref:hypothetical protein n=1 Tax=Kribbella sp. NPDC051718 TaxID=3155168 RepID=UPI003420DA09